MTNLRPTSARRKGRWKGPVAVVVGMLLVGGAAYTGAKLLNPTATAPATPGSSSSVSASASGATKCPTPISTSAVKLVIPKPAAVTVNVYNATTRSGLARTTATAMKARGFATGDVANDPLNKTVNTPAEVRYAPKSVAAAKLVQAQVTGAVLAPDTRTDATVDLVIGNAYGALATPNQTAINLATAIKPAPRPSGC